MKSPSRSVISFADRLGDELRILGLYHDDAAFYDDLEAGKYRTVGQWTLHPRYPLSICVYASSFETKLDCWVGFGARNPLPVELLKKEMSGSFVELTLDELNAGWSSLNKARQDELSRAAFTVLEDWRPRGGNIWLARYFRSDQIDEATEFLRQIIKKTRSSSSTSNAARKTEASAKAKVRIGQGDFRTEVIERWGRTCALTGSDVVGVLDAAHIVSWALNTKERLSPENGLLLAPNVHRLLEAGLISFADDASLRTKLSVERLEQLGLRENMSLSLPLTKRQRGWMKEHRKKHGLEDPPKLALRPATNINGRSIRADT